MNFNLVSNETNNGHEYNVRLSNPVTIPANSNVYMNFAEMTRDSKINLTEKGKVTLTIDKVFPDVIPNDRTTKNNPLIVDPAASTDFTNSFEIPVGTYTFTAFRNLINDGLKRLTNGTHADFYSARADEADIFDGKDNDVKLGYCFGRKFGDSVDPGNQYSSVSTQGFSAINKHKAKQHVPDATEPGGIRDVAYAKEATANPTQYDNYALSAQHYWHYAFRNLRTGGVEDANQSRDQNLIIAESILPIHQMTGAITLGFYSPEYALMSGGASRTAGAAEPRNIPTTATTSSKLACFCGIECVETGRTGPQSGTLRVNWGTTTIDGVQKTSRDWPNINQTISGTKTDVVGHLTNIFSGTDQVTMAIQFYLDESQDIYKTEPRLYLRIFKIGNVGTTELYQEMIYDSALTGEYIPHTFFQADASFYDTANKVNSQIPFSIIMSAQVENEGWERVLYTALDKTINTSDDDKPATIIDSYSLTFNGPLSKVFLQTNTDRQYPNFSYDDFSRFYRRDFSLEWRRKNYSIFLNELPITNYKNVDNKKQPAYPKTILANIPAPFGIASQLIEPQQDESELVSVYQPYNPIITELRNNEIVLNNFSIRIVDMESEETATEIIDSVINFTINSPIYSSSHSATM